MPDASVLVEAPVPELPTTVWLHIFSFLHVPALQAAARVCQEWSRMVATEGLWEAVAQATYPPRTLVPAAYRGSYRVWLYFDVRGEVDLRDPSKSSLSVVRLNRRRDIRSRRAQADPDHLAALERATLRRPLRLLAAAHAAEPPSSVGFMARSYRQHKGVLEWTGEPLGRLLRALQEHGGALMFSYACNISSRQPLQLRRSSPPPPPAAPVAWDLCSLPNRIEQFARHVM
eukprot:XP_001699361.1 predicted protein [Chlamydomonas reinhardtii]